MTQSKKVGSHYRVYDPVLNVARKFKSKAAADEFAASLNGNPVDNTTAEKTTPKTENKK